MLPAHIGNEFVAIKVLTSLRLFPASSIAPPAALAPVGPDPPVPVPLPCPPGPGRPVALPVPGPRGPRARGGSSGWAPPPRRHGAGFKVFDRAPPPRRSSCATGGVS